MLPTLGLLGPKVDARPFLRGRVGSYRPNVRVWVNGASPMFGPWSSRLHRVVSRASWTSHSVPLKPTHAPVLGAPHRWRSYPPLSLGQIGQLGPHPRDSGDLRAVHVFNYRLER